MTTESDDLTRQLQALKDQAAGNGTGAGGTPAAPAPTLTWHTAAELRELTPVEPEWIWHGFIARGSITLVSGKPKSGKSTLILAAVEAIAARAPSFLGHTITPTPVVYVSEEMAGTLSHKLPVPGHDVHVLSREHAYPKPTWAALIAAAVEKAIETDARIICIDTFSFWVALAAETEKDAGAIGQAMAPLLEAARHGIAIVIIAHERKGGGEDGEGVRGSTAITGSVDLILELGRVLNPAHRSLLILSRYPSSPGTLILSRDPSTTAWGVVGESAERGDTRDLVDHDGLIDALRNGPWQGLTRADLEAALDAPFVQFAKQLDGLVARGVAARDGGGKRGDPYLWRFCASVSVDTKAQKGTETPDEKVCPPDSLGETPLTVAGGQGHTSESAKTVSVPFCAPAYTETCTETELVPGLEAGVVPFRGHTSQTGTGQKDSSESVPPDPYLAELSLLDYRTSACRTDEDWAEIEQARVDLAARYPDRERPS